MSKTGNLVTTDEKAAEVVTLFVSVFASNLSSYPSRVDGSQDGDWGEEFFPQ